MLAAMDGQESIPPGPSKETRDEPTAFFWAIFGLVYESLVTPVQDSDLTAQRTSSVALQALKCLVQQKYCGKVFTDGQIFEEVVNLFYRMALTESAAVQIYLVDTVASLATSLDTKVQSNGNAYVIETYFSD